MQCERGECYPASTRVDPTHSTTIQFAMNFSTSLSSVIYCARVFARHSSLANAFELRNFHCSHVPHITAKPNRLQSLKWAIVAANDSADRKMEIAERVGDAKFWHWMRTLFGYRRTSSQSKIMRSFYDLYSVVSGRCNEDGLGEVVNDVDEMGKMFIVKGQSHSWHWMRTKTIQTPLAHFIGGEWVREQWHFVFLIINSSQVNGAEQIVCYNSSCSERLNNSRLVNEAATG